MSILGDKGEALVAVSNDFAEDVFEEVEAPAGDFHSLSSLFDLGQSECKVKFGSSINYNGVVTKIMSEVSGGFPSSLIFSSVRLSKLIEILKEFGEVKTLTSKTYFSGIPTQFILEVITENGNSMYLSATEVGSVSPEKYPEYKDDVISGETYIENLEDNSAGEILYTNNPTLFFNTSETSIANEIGVRVNKESLIEFKTIDETYVEMIIQTSQGLATKQILFEHEYDDSDLDFHYGSGFSDFHNALVERITERNKGITMLHGPPGTGKTHYIRRLLPELSKADKRVILIPKHILGSLESPGFNEFMLRNFIGEKIVFVIEDAESIIAKRAASGEHRSELVSTLLNVTDGILNDIFNIQVILTFNTGLKSIDEALQRPGRLTAKYRFEALDRADALKMADHIGVEILDNEPSYTLASIYALREVEEDEILINQKKKTSPVGF